VEVLDSHPLEVRPAKARGVDSAYRPILQPRQADAQPRAIERFCPVLLGNSAANG
jgi:hypothetical protein